MLHDADECSLVSPPYVDKSVGHSYQPVAQFERVHLLSSLVDYRHRSIFVFDDFRSLNDIEFVAVAFECVDA